MTTLQQAREAACNKYAWPGGYPLYLLCADGEVICPACAKKEWKQVAYATKHPGTDKQWEIAADSAELCFEREGFRQQRVLFVFGNDGYDVICDNTQATGEHGYWNKVIGIVDKYAATFGG